MWDMKNYKHLSQNERELIFLYRGQKKSCREIAGLIDRDPRSVGREIKRNGFQNYSPSEAQSLTDKRRKENKIGKFDDSLTKKYVIAKLGRHWSPEQISGRLKLRWPHLAVSAEGIYQFIYKKENRKLRLWEFLRRRHNKRQLFNQRKVNKTRIPNRVLISKRPEEVALRKTFGHWETDNMEGIKSSLFCASVTVERKSRLVKIDKLEDGSSQKKKESLIKQFGLWPSSFVKSLTMDNGHENYDHEEIARFLNCPTYFCNPYHCWEKGTVENTIGLMRQYVPKKTDLREITKAEFNQIAWELNNRPRKTLGFQTPLEVFNKETHWGT